jgi:DNA-binding HxlR family transcriptional regulator
MIALDDPAIGGLCLRDLGTLDATLGECGEVTLLALMDGARTPEEIRAITGLTPKLVSARLRVLVDLELARVSSEGYVLTDQGLKLALIVAERRNSHEPLA